MGAAVALAIMLVVVVGVLSLAVNAQGPVQGGGLGGPSPRAGRGVGHPGTTAPTVPRPPRRPQRDRPERAPVPPDAGSSKGPVKGSSKGPVKGPGEPADPDQLFGDLKPLNTPARALVVSVVDERTLGPVTRSRLTLKVQPPAGDPFEVTTRVAFPTPEDRARVKVGATIPVRYDSNDHRRVVVDMDSKPED